MVLHAPVTIQRFAVMTVRETAMDWINSQDTDPSPHGLSGLPYKNGFPGPKWSSEFRISRPFRPMVRTTLVSSCISQTRGFPR